MSSSESSLWIHPNGDVYVVERSRYGLMASRCHKGWEDMETWIRLKHDRVPEDWVLVP